MYRALAAAALVGCYQPAAETACAIRCPCQLPLQCGPDGLCHGAGDPPCSAQPQDGGVDTSTDAMIDSSKEVSDAACYGNGLGVRLCTLGTVSRSFPTERDVITTNATCDYMPPQAANQPPLCVIAGTNISITGTLTVTGPNPIVLFATGSISISNQGVVRAGSYSNGTVGPNANHTCAAVALVGGDGAGSTAAGGGAGGSYQGKGGDGGGGYGNAGNAGTATAEPKPTFVRGGCAGGAGGTDAFTTAGGRGGNSGGAIYLLAGGSISIDGVLDASGEGGGAGPSTSEAGAGAGGSGGLIVLDAPTIAATGLILASGGGGGGGGGGTAALTPSSDGSDPTTTNAATGGNGAGNGGPGGAGSSRSSNAGTIASGGGMQTGGAVTRGCGGGGGGGGAGWIMTFPQTTLTDNNVAPIPQ